MSRSLIQSLLAVRLAIESLWSRRLRMDFVFASSAFSELCIASAGPGLRGFPKVKLGLVSIT